MIWYNLEGLSVDRGKAPVQMSQTLGLGLLRVDLVAFPVAGVPDRRVLEPGHAERERHLPALIVTNISSFRGSAGVFPAVGGLCFLTWAKVRLAPIAAVRVIDATSAGRGTAKS
jgi:hypothetical protein